MSAKIIDGKLLARKLKGQYKEKISQLVQKGIKPGLAVVIVGEDPASKIYVSWKRKDCQEIGVYSEEHALEESTNEQELISLIESLNKRKDIHGILVQLPLPSHIDEEKILNTIDPKKDVDGFHPINVGKIMIGNYDFVPCTPAGVIEMIEEAGVNIEGKECVIVGRSNIVGKPQAMLLLHKNGTVTICHSKTKDLKEACLRADILIAAVGRAKMITKEMVKPGAVVIDVGMNKDENGKLCGDVDFEQVCNIASAITPVPGGVGPMTRAMLLKNTLTAAIINS